jgi:hypothetical protein
MVNRRNPNSKKQNAEITGREKTQRTQINAAARVFAGDSRFAFFVLFVANLSSGFSHLPSVWIRVIRGQISSCRAA